MTSFGKDICRCDEVRMRVGPHPTTGVLIKREVWPQTDTGREAI